MPQRKPPQGSKPTIASDPSPLSPRREPWTDAQWRGIVTCDRSLLVSAAAGSGKTAVLAQRCVYLVCEENPPCDLDELLVVTFTDSAAAQMKQRIESALRKHAATHPSEHLSRQLALIDQANVSTLHRFCAQALRQNFQLVGLDPNFTVLDADAATLLRQETARALFHQRYADDNAGDFSRFIDCFGNGDDARLIEQVIFAHALLSSLIDPQAWIAAQRAMLREAAERPIEQSTLGRRLIAAVDAGLTELARRCQSAIASLSCDAVWTKYCRQLHECGQIIAHYQRLLQSEGIDAVVETARALELEKAPPIASSVPGKERASALLTDIKNAVRLKDGALADLLKFSGDDWRQTMADSLPHAELFLNLVGAFGEAYQKAKRAERGLDFNDLERYALQVLCDPEARGLAPSRVAAGYRSQFRHVLVDEYQDINELQDAIIALVSREGADHPIARGAPGEKSALRGGNLFSVGDVKQSIFRFRLAEPRQFLDRQKRYRDPAQSFGSVIDLQENFRSRAKLLDAVNAIFARLMSESAAEIEYDRSHYLNAKAAFPDGSADNPRVFTGAPLELHLLHCPARGEHVGGEDEQDELDRTEAEALFAARRIAQLLGRDGSAPMLVADRDANGQPMLRDIRPNDIVILLRAMQFKADAFADALRRSGISAFSEGGSGFFAAAEIRDMLALLHLLDNRQQDIPLAAYLRSPLCAMPDSEDAMAAIRLAYPDEALKSGEMTIKRRVPFHEAALRYASEQSDHVAENLRKIFGQLDAWRDMARQRPPAEVIWEIYQQSGYLAYCQGLSDGPQRVANLFDLHERARQFSDFAKQGLWRFLRFLDSLRDQGDLQRPSPSGEDPQAVRVMSIHRAKGLEFPVVLIPDLGKKFNLQDCAGAILIDRAAGLGVSVVDEARRIRYPSLAHTLTRRQMRRATLAEEMRLLYVALTRAKEHAILIGTVAADAMGKWSAAWAGYAGQFPAEAILDAHCPLDWLGPSAAAGTTAGDDDDAIFRVVEHSAETIRAWPNPRAPRQQRSARQESLAALKPLDPPPLDSGAAAVMQRLEWRYPFEPATREAAAVPVTALSKGGDARDEPDQPATTDRFLKTLAPPACIEPLAAPLATAIGDYTHRMLEHLDLARPCDLADLETQKAELCTRNLLTAAQAKVIDLPSLAWLMQTEAGRLLRGQGVRRELAFVMAAASDSADPLDAATVRGRIDALAPDGDGVAIIDYKTDNIGEQTIEARAAAYAQQMAYYREAVEAIAQRKVTRVLLVFLRARQLRIV